MIPTDTIDKLAECFAALSDLGAQLSETDWAAPTDLPGWDVKDNLAHIIGTERGLQGLPFTAHRSPTRDYVRNPIGEAGEHEVDARRGMSGAEVLQEWNQLAALRLGTLRAADDAYFAREMINPTGPGTLADFLHVRVLDCWVHEQDMRRAVHRPGHLGGPAAEHTIDRLLRTVPIVVGKRAATPEGRAVAFHITADPALGGVVRDLVCEVQNGRAAVVATPQQPPLATITIGTEGFLVLATGRRTADQVTATIEGDQELGRAVLGKFNMMI
jgi:uncharacterized protein (TIGR03083 family)